MRAQLLTLLVLVSVSVCMTVVSVVCSSLWPQAEGWSLIGAGLSWLVTALATTAAAVQLGVRWVAKQEQQHSGPKEESQA